jgi:hypothetical protein
MDAVWKKPTTETRRKSSTGKAGALGKRVDRSFESYRGSTRVNADYYARFALLRGPAAQGRDVILRLYGTAKAVP